MKKIVLIFSLVIIAVIGYGIFKFYTLSLNLKERIEIMVYLYDGADIGSVKNAITALKEVSRVNFIPKDSAVEMLKKEMGEDSQIFSAIKINPIPNSFIVTIKGAEVSPPALEKAVASIQSIPGVEEVRYEKRFANKILGLVKLAEKIVIMGSAIIVFYCIIVLLVIFGSAHTLTHIN